MPLARLFRLFFQKLRGPEKGRNFEEGCGGSSSKSVLMPKFRFFKEVSDTKKPKKVTFRSPMIGKTMYYTAWTLALGPC